MKLKKYDFVVVNTHSSERYLLNHIVYNFFKDGYKGFENEFNTDWKEYIEVKAKEDKNGGYLLMLKYGFQLNEYYSSNSEDQSKKLKLNVSRETLDQFLLAFVFIYNRFNKLNKQYVITILGNFMPEYDYIPTELHQDISNFSLEKKMILGEFINQALKMKISNSMFQEFIKTFVVGLNHSGSNLKLNSR